MYDKNYFLVTTSRSLLLIESKSGLAYCIDTGRHHYYGVARDIEHFYVGVRGRPNTSSIPKDEERGKIICFDHTLVYKGEIAPQFPMRDIHQIIVHDEKLWVTCTFDNMIAIFDGVSWEKWYPLGPTIEGEHDVNHFNSLTGFDNELCIVAHNKGVKTGKPSELHFFQLPEKRWLKSLVLGNLAHNAWLHAGDLMTCSSGDGLLVGANGKTIFTGGFPRGVTYFKDEICVGISEFASRPDRDLGNGWIKIFDKNWKHLRTIIASDQGMITDLLAITMVEAERILSGHNFPPIQYIVE